MSSPASAQVGIGPHVDVQIEVAGRAGRAGRGAPLPGTRSRPPVSTPGGIGNFDGAAPLPVRMVRFVPSAASQKVTGSWPTMSAPRLWRGRTRPPHCRVWRARPPRVAEQAGEHVVDVEVAAELDAARVAARVRRTCGRTHRHRILPACRPARTGASLQPIVFLALLRVAEHGVRFVDLLEAFGLLLVIAGDVGVVLLRQLAIRLFDGLIVGALGDAQRLIQIFHRRSLVIMTRLRRVARASAPSPARRRRPRAAPIDDGVAGMELAR